MSVSYRSVLPLFIVPEPLGSCLCLSLHPQLQLLEAFFIALVIPGQASLCSLLILALLVLHSALVHQTIVTYRGFYSRLKFLQTLVGRLHSAMSHTNSHYCSQKILQTQVRSQPLRSSGTNSHSCNQESSKHTCFSRNFPVLTQSSNQQESVSKHTSTSTLSDFQTRTDYKSI
jgi:hypothetical protein